MPDILEKYPGMSLELENQEGIRYNLKGVYGNGWFLLRPSLHEPLLVLQIENDIKGKNSTALQVLSQELAAFPDIEPLILAENKG